MKIRKIIGALLTIGGIIMGVMMQEGRIVILILIFIAGNNMEQYKEENS